MKAVSLSAVHFFPFKLAISNVSWWKKGILKQMLKPMKKIQANSHTGTGNRVQQFKSWLYFLSISALRANQDMKQVWWWKKSSHIINSRKVQELCEHPVTSKHSDVIVSVCLFVCLSVSCLVSTVFNISRSNYVWCQIPTTAGADLILGKIESRSHQMWKQLYLPIFFMDRHQTCGYVG